MVKKTIFFFALLIIYTSASLAKTYVAVSNPYPPFAVPDVEGEGFSMEIIRAAFKTQGDEVKLLFMPWARAETGLKEGKYDILINVWHSEDRLKDMLYSESYATNRIKFIKKKGDKFEYEGIGSLKGKNIGIVRGYAYNDEFLGATTFKKDIVNDLHANINKLLANRIDLTLEDELVARDILTKADPKIFDKIEFSKNALVNNAMYITSGFKNPNHKEIISRFNAGLKVIQGNGTLDKIFAKYSIVK